MEASSRLMSFPYFIKMQQALRINVERPPGLSGKRLAIYHATEMLHAFAGSHPFHEDVHIMSGSPRSI